MSFAAVNHPVSVPPQEIAPKAEENEPKPKYKSYKYGWKEHHTNWVPR